jgi:hypothetical protein
MFHALTLRQIPAPKGKRIPSRKVRGRSHKSARAHAKHTGTQVPSSHLSPRLLQYLEQSVRVGRGGALLVVVEIDEHRAALAPPFTDVTRPGA